jgi:hypothetical protein
MRLNRDLGLKGNPFHLYERLFDKRLMQESLKESGLRYIKTKVIKSVDDAMIFFEGLNGKRVVIKPSR